MKRCADYKIEEECNAQERCTYEKIGIFSASKCYSKLYSLLNEDYSNEQILQLEEKLLEPLERYSDLLEDEILMDLTKLNNKENREYKKSDIPYFLTIISDKKFKNVLYLNIHKINKIELLKTIQKDLPEIKGALPYFIFRTIYSSVIGAILYRKTETGVNDRYVKIMDEIFEKLTGTARTYFFENSIFPITKLDTVSINRLKSYLIEDIIALNKPDLIYKSMQNILKSILLKNIHHTYIFTLGTKEEQNESIRLYEKVTSEHIIELIRGYSWDKIDGEKLARMIMNHLNLLVGREDVTNTDILSIPTYIYRSILDLLNIKLEDNKNNTSLVYLSDSSYIKTEFIENIRFSSYRSILKNFNRFNTANKGSMSNSIVFWAELKEDIKSEVNSVLALKPTQLSMVYFKIYPIGNLNNEYGESIVLDTTGLDVEKRCYDELFKLVKYNVMPNVLCKVATAYLDNFDTDFYESIPGVLEVTDDSCKKKSNSFTNRGYDKCFKNLIHQQIYKANTRLELYQSTEPDIDIIWKNTGLIMTQPGGVKLEDARFFVLNDKRSVLFQILYTLYIFEKIGFSHGDLHFGNIFVVEVPETTLNYIIDGVKFSFNTKRIVKIYDFDGSCLFKASSIIINTNSEIDINEIPNSSREMPTDIKTRITPIEIFNKNADKYWIFFQLIDIFSKIPSNAEMDLDTIDIMKFIIMSMPALIPCKLNDFIHKNIPEHISKCELTIGETYTEELAEDISKFGFLETEWLSRYKWSKIHKEIKGRYKNLWIPDSIIPDTLIMLKSDLFNVLRQTPDESINVRSKIWYTIDNRLKI